MALLPTPGSDTTPGFGGKPGGGGILDTALNILDPGKIRLKVAGLIEGGLNSIYNPNKQAGVISNGPTGTVSKNNTDWRVKISLPSASPVFYNDRDNQLQAILRRTNGVIFPYTPTVSVTHNARYQEQALTHSNYKNYFYEGSDVSAITIAGDFTVQNVDEGLYLLAAIYFFRSATKMFFGIDELAGNPPPTVYLDGYGDFYFPHVSCVVTSFQHTMPAEVDYVEIPYSEVLNSGGTWNAITRLPTTSTVSITVQPVYSRNNIHNNMNLIDFSRGMLLTDANGKAGFL
jgi:hypothetical protein